MTLIWRGYFDSIPHDRLIACVRMRVVDGAVLGLIRQWLNAPVMEPPEHKGQPPTIRRNSKGTPQGGVLSPLLANIYLHWFDRVFHRTDGPAHWARAKLVRYADDFVVLARYISPQLRRFIEGKLEGWLGLQLNRDKTRLLDLQQPVQSLDFLDYTFRHDRDRLGRDKRYWNLMPSRKAVTRERAVLHEKLSLWGVRRITSPQLTYGRCGGGAGWEWMIDLLRIFGVKFAAWAGRSRSNWPNIKFELWRCDPHGRATSYPGLPAG